MSNATYKFSTSDNIVKYGLLTIFIALTIASIYPLFWLILSSLKTPGEMFGDTWALPEVLIWDNYISAWNYGISQYLISSVIVTAISTILTVFLSASCAFALVILNFKGRVIVYALILGGSILPPEVSLFPLFRTLSSLGIYNTYWALIIPYLAFGLPFTTFLIRAYMVKIPVDLHEAATVDGAGPFWSFWNIYLPLSKPILASAALITAMRVWNEFIFALTFVESESVKTITIGMMSFANALSGNWSVLMAGLVISILPMLTIFLILQKQFVGGLTQGAVK